MATQPTLIHALIHWAQSRPQSPAIHEKAPHGSWRTWTWARYWQDVRELAKGFIALGHEPGECIALIGGSRCGWVISQFAIMAARGVPASIYPNNTADQASYIVGNSRSRIVIADTAVQLAKYREGIDRGLMTAEHLVLMDEPVAGVTDVLSLAAVQALGREQSDAELDRRLAEMTADETAMLIYTSGTTGVPKGVQLSHGNIAALSDGLFERFPAFLDEVPYRVISYLPLCHIAEQIATNFGQMGTGGEVFFCADIARIKHTLTDVRPTVFLGVPRVWEKFQAALESKLGEARGLKAALAGWARRTELAAMMQQAETGRPSGGLGRFIANKLVVSKVKEALGLDRLYLAVTGAAPISQGTLEFFGSLGITIYEVYGMSETTGICTSAGYGRPRFGSVGRAMPGVEIRIAHDAEILVKGPICTKGYLHMPEETAELYDEEGWLHTGDLGAMDAEGYVRITGRKKDILVTAGGKNIAPAEMEGHINQIPGVGQVVVVGDKMPYLGALITLDVEALDVLAKEAGVAPAPLAELAAQPAIHDHLMKRIEADCNAKVARYQTIKRIAVLPVEFSVDGGELTPTMKAKRNVVVEKYAREIAALYA